MERSVPHAGAPPELCHAAATCLRRMEEAAPTLLLAGAKQLLDLARQETSGAAEAYAMLAARVLAHGAGGRAGGPEQLARGCAAMELGVRGCSLEATVLACRLAGCWWLAATPPTQRCQLPLVRPPAAARRGSPRCAAAKQLC